MSGQAFAFVIKVSNQLARSSVMKTYHSLFVIWAGSFALLLFTVPASSQSIASSAQTFADTKQAFLAERQRLMTEEITFLSADVSDEDVEVWHKQHDAEFQSLQQMAARVSAISMTQPMSFMEVPANVDPADEKAVFFQQQALLENAFATAHNKLWESIPTSTIEAMAQTPEGVAQLEQMRHKEEVDFEQQNAADIQAQKEWAQYLTAKLR